MMKAIAFFLFVSFASISCSSLPKGMPSMAGAETKKLTLADVNAGFAAQKDSPLDVFKTQEVPYSVYGIADVDSYLFAVAKLKGTAMLVAKMKELATSGDVSALKIDSFKDAESLKNGTVELVKTSLDLVNATIETGKNLVLNVATVASAKPTAVPSITSDLNKSLDTLKSVSEELSK